MLLLVLLVPRLYASLTVPLSGRSFGGSTTGAFGWLGMAAEAALVGVAVWWLTRAEDIPLESEPVDPGTPVPGPTAG